MNVKYFFLVVLMAVSYWLFSNEFFKFSAEIKGKKVSFVSRFLSFLVIYVWFVTASIFELPLVVNWLVFLVILGIEVHVVFSFDFLVSYVLSMSCAITGLAANIFFRSFVSILLKTPLNIFDKAMSSLKTYPIFLGFMAMVLLLYILRRHKFSSQFERMLHYKKSLTFCAWTEIFIYLFLIVQLLVYTQSGDTVGIKLWGIKSSLFSVTVLIIALIYSLRVASLHYYMEKQHEIRDHLIQDKRDINKLWELAYTDMLTGCSNRQLLDKRLEEYAGYGGIITLAFIDVNGLKTVNDQYGHMEGDRYLVSIAHTLSELTAGVNVDLFRYGGDEFIMISNTLPEKELTHLLVRTNELLKSSSLQYRQSVSYGVVHGDSMDYHKLIDVADDLMYKHKLKHYESIVRS